MQRNLILLFCLFWSASCFAAPFDYSSFARLPVQDEGRIKPFETFAEVYLERFNGSTSVDGTPAIDWLAQLLFDPANAMERPLFPVKDTDARTMLNLPEKTNYRYNFQEVMSALGKSAELVQSLLNTQPSALNASQRTVLELYDHVTTFAQIARSFTLLLPLSLQLSPEQMQSLGMPTEPTTFTEALAFLHPMQEQLRSIVRQKGKNPEAYTPAEIALAEAAEKISMIEQSSLDSTQFRVIPPPWEHNTEWISPWTLFHSGQGSPQTGNLLNQWRALAQAYLTSDTTHFHDVSNSLLGTMQYAPQVRPAALQVEMLYDRTAILHVTIGFYITGFLCVLLCVAGVPYVRVPARVMIASGGFIHFLAVASRVFILLRPPVGTLYESLLFVSLIGVLFGLILEIRLRNYTGLLAASVAGALLLIASESLRMGEDSMSMLVAVLNTNFWLATHVLCITTGYGFGLIAGLTAHFYLILRVLQREPKRTAAVYRTIYASALITLLFTSLGTILGGIWADQSWGRFWGWDPKENGAMLICLWLIWLLHGRITARFSEGTFGLLLALLNVVIALSWLGVNLLSTGLHSYGFTDKAALTLWIFCSVEGAFVLLMALLLPKQKYHATLA